MDVAKKFEVATSFRSGNTNILDTDKMYPTAALNEPRVNSNRQSC